MRRLDARNHFEDQRSGSVYHRSELSGITIEVKRMDRGNFCSVKIFAEDGKVTLILPLGN